MKRGGLPKKRAKWLPGVDSFSTEVFTYTYDSMDENGNWTQRTEYDGEGKVLEVKKRSYTYFKKE